MTVDIWFKDPIDFFSLSKLFVVYPSNALSLEERLNAYLRLSIYLSLGYYIISNDIKVFNVVVVVMILTFVYYKSVRENYVQYEELVNEESDIHEKKKPINCEYPKKNNPFMNVLMNEYVENPQRNEACDTDNVQIKNSIHDKYYKDMYREIDDVFDRKSSFRNFYTMPNTTIPNNQEDYANWLYGIRGKTHKEGNGNRNKHFAKYY